MHKPEWFEKMPTTREEVEAAIDALENYAEYCAAEAEALREDAGEYEDDAADADARIDELRELAKGLLSGDEDPEEYERHLALDAALNHPGQLKLEV